MELIAGSTDQNQNLNGDLAALGQMQRISRRDNQAAVERSKVVEAAYQTVRGSRTYRATVYAEEVSDAAFLMSGDSGFMDSANLLPDMSSLGTIFDVGDYRRMGYFRVRNASSGRSRGNLRAGRADGFASAQSSNAPAADGDDLRSGSTLRRGPGSQCKRRPWCPLPVFGHQLRLD